jgi:hypothetical protein
MSQPTFETVEAVVRHQLATALGGKRGMAEAAVPTLLFTFVWLGTKDVKLALGFSLGAALMLLGLRLLQRSTVQFVANAIFGIGTWRPVPGDPPTSRPWPSSCRV